MYSFHPAGIATSLFHRYSRKHAYRPDLPIPGLDKCLENGDNSPKCESYTDP